MRITHTSVRDTGQIYVPFVNWGLFVFIVLAVALFKTSSNLASAYGIAVTLDMTITTVMTFFVIRYGWKYPLPLCLLATGFFFVIDVTFFASNLLKLRPNAAWRKRLFYEAMEIEASPLVAAHAPLLWLVRRGRRGQRPEPPAAAPPMRCAGCARC